MSKTSLRLIAAASFTLASTVALAPAAHAQAVRTWVSGVGDDANPCSRTAPCKTFAGTISKTAAGGEINCLDPGGWGAVTITKSITIDCSQFPGSILNTGTNGINIVAATTDVVVIRGLEISTYPGGAIDGLSGVRVLQAGTVTLDNVVIRNQGSYGVSVVSAGGTRLNMIDVKIHNNGLGGGVGTAGVMIQPTSGAVYVSLQGVRATGGIGNGLNIMPGGGAVLATVHDSTFSNYTGAGVSMTTTSAAQAGRLIVKNSQLNYNATGVTVTGMNLVAGLGNTVVTGNTTGLVTSGVHAALGVRTFGTNQVSGNSVDGTFTGPIPQQ